MSLSTDRLKQAIIHEWDASSETYDNQEWHGFKSIEERVKYGKTLKTAFPRNASAILDVGCGTGDISMLLADMGYRVNAIDFSEKMLARARRKAYSRGLGIHFEIGDAENLPFIGGCFDIIFARHVLWTLPDPVKTLGEWRRILKEGGAWSLLMACGIMIRSIHVYIE